MLPMTGSLLGVGVLMLVVPINRLTQRVNVYEHGFVWRRVFVTRRVLRSEVTGVTIYNGVDVFVERARGVNCTIKGIKDPAQLARFVGPQTMPVAPGAPAGQPSAGHAVTDLGTIQGWTPGAWQPPTRSDR